jgi:hypothetical protein
MAPITPPNISDMLLESLGVPPGGLSAAAESLGKLSEALAPLCDYWRRQQEALQAATLPLIEMTQKAHQAQPKVIPYLLDRGWYLTMEFPIGWFVTFDELRQAGRHSDVDDLMCQLADETAAKTEADLLARFPSRAVILTAAFEAHRAGNYPLCIPAFLAQADGIGCEVLDLPRQFFPPSKRSAGLQQKLGAFAAFGQPGVIAAAWKETLDLLDQQWSLAEDTDVRKQRQQTEHWFGPLNRHGVLHGHDTDYPSRENSCRCVLLLQYLLDVDHVIREKLPKEAAWWGEWERRAQDLYARLGQQANG